MMNDSTICALSTPHGISAIAQIRVSGKDSFKICDKIFKSKKGIKIEDLNANTLIFGEILDELKVIDEVIVSKFIAPQSFTGENSIEISSHGSTYIIEEILSLLIKNGAKYANPGEFTQRAYLNGKFDLAQAEAIADLIASESEASHKLALNQMKGGVSAELKVMRDELLDMTSLLELELDFSDEDVEFADRSKLLFLLDSIITHTNNLIDSFKVGDAIKNGVPVAIIGSTNTGKSTLLNAILNEERAIVSDIHGTTRDYLEDKIIINGITFRFIDTAGIRDSNEIIEKIGIERSFEKIKKASIILLILDSTNPNSFGGSLEILQNNVNEDQIVFVLLNKIDLVEKSNIDVLEKIKNTCNVKIYKILEISAKQKIGIDDLKILITELPQFKTFNSSSTLITNYRHLEALKASNSALERARIALNGSLPSDLVSQDIRESIFHLSEITGEINTEEILGNIFSKFCIGK